MADDPQRTPPPGSPDPGASGGPGAPGGPSAGSNPPPRTLRISPMVLLIGAGVLLLVIAGCSAVVVVALNAAGSAIDPGRNRLTGLADGTYVLSKQSSVVIEDQCSFTGPVRDAGTGAPASESVTVVGSGSDCGYGTRTELVAFTVSGGTAEITAVR